MNKGTLDINYEEFRNVLDEMLRRAEQVEKRIEELLEKLKRKARRPEPTFHGS